MTNPKQDNTPRGLPELTYQQAIQRAHWDHGTNYMRMIGFTETEISDYFGLRPDHNWGKK